MKKRERFFTREQSLCLRGIGALMVILSHYASWYADLIGLGVLHDGLIRFGVYGVDIFLLLSGYGLVKSVQKKPLWEKGSKNASAFWKNRIRNTWLPYIMIAGIIALSEGTLKTGTDWTALLSGAPYWYIRNILIFYLLFFTAYFLFRKKWLRLAFLTAGILLYSVWLLVSGHGYFWYVSNVTFLLGVWLAEYEENLVKAADFGYPVWLLLLTVGVAAVVVSGMLRRFTVFPDLIKARDGILATLIWTLFVIQTAHFLPVKSKILTFCGKLSLELYLWHVFLYHLAVEKTIGANRMLQGGIAAALTLILSLGVHVGIEKGWTYLSGKGKQKKETEKEKIISEKKRGANESRN